MSGGGRAQGRGLAPPAPEVVMYAPASKGRTASRLVLAIGASIVAALVVVGIAVVLSLSRDAAWQAPEFPSLADDPDPTIGGTVAYLDDATGCVDVVAAGGGPSTEVFCIPDEPVEKSQQLGKPLGPQLVWLEDGRLEVTMFRMTDPPGPLFDPGRQWVVDVRTGEVEQVPDAEAPGAANRRTHPTTNARGESVLVDRGPRSVEVSLRTDGGTRTLLAVRRHPRGRVLGQCRVLGALRRLDRGRRRTHPRGRPRGRGGGPRAHRRQQPGPLRGRAVPVRRHRPGGPSGLGIRARSGQGRVRG